MKKAGRILSFIMALVMTFSSVNLSVVAAEIENETVIEEGNKEKISVSDNKIEVSVSDNEIKNMISDNEMGDKMLDEETESLVPDNEDGNSLSDNSQELSVSVNDMKEEDSTKEELPDEDKKTAMEYDDLMELEFEPIDIDEEEAYDPHEIVEIAESMPSYLSESYGLYGDKYTSYYIYNQLDEDTKEFWDAMEIVYSNYMENEDDISAGHAGVWKIKTNGKTFSQIQGMLLLFKYTHPQYYYLSNKVFYNKNFQEGQENITIGFGVYEKFQEGTVRKAATAQIITLLDSWSTEIAQLENEEKKVQAIHDQICNKVDYNDEVVSDGNIYQNEEEMYFTQSAYSVFCTDSTVCAGYTQAFTWMCNAMDIEVFGVTSYNHAWNKVKVNDDWYNVDCTWNDGDGAGNITYNYYLKNDNYYDTYGAVSSHQEEEQWLEYLPKCTLDSGSHDTVAGTLPAISTQSAAPEIMVVYGEDFCTITMTKPAENAKIYYTLDGKLPSEACSQSFVYEAPFTVDKAGDIKAVVVENERLDSKIIQIRVEPGTDILAMGDFGNGITWKLDAEGCLTLSGSGNISDYGNGRTAPWYGCAEKVTRVVMEEGITGIGVGAFYGLHYLENVTIPETVTVIGTEAFEECTGLGEIIIPQSVTVIGEDAFPKYVVIAAYPGSMAQRYAEEQGYEFADMSAEGSQIKEFRVEGFVQESPEMVYTGKEIKQNISVYHNDTLLVENVDYTLNYQNNVNAATYDTLYAPSVTVIMKGQYEGSKTLYYTILPREMKEEEFAGYEQIIAYGEQIVIPKPVVYYQSKALIPDKDFRCDYSGLPDNYLAGSSYNKGEVYAYEVKGMGNFTGSFFMNLVVVDNQILDLSKAEVKLNKYIYEFDGNPLTAEEVEIAYVRAKGTDIDSRYYTCNVQAEKTGAGYIYIVPTQEGINGGYYGRKEIQITLVAERSMADVVSGTNWKDEIPFSKTKLMENGGVYQEQTKLLCYEGENGFEDLVEGTDYTVKYGKAEEVGKVTVIFYGKGRYAGTLKKTYSIIPNLDLSVQWKETDIIGKPIVYYQKEGAMPEFQLMDADGKVLKKGTDYNLRTKDNQKLGIMVLEIIGIGNYKGYRLKADVWVLAGNIGKCIMTVDDAKYSEKTDAWKSPVEVRDVNGRKLVSGKDYEKEILYTYENMEENSIPDTGTVIQVTVTGKNNYAGSTLTGSYRICKIDLEDLEIVIDAREYTGQEIKLRKRDVHLYADWNDRRAGKEITTNCYKIIGYEKNDRVGVANVMLQGKGEYGGTRICHFMIYKKLFNTVRVEKIELGENNLVMGVGQTKKLSCKFYPENVDNKTIIWSSADEEIVSVDKEGNITAQKAGEVTIKATSQDSGKIAVCNIKVKNIPVSYFELNTSRVEGYGGETYQLEALSRQPENANGTSALWKSSDCDVVSVDTNGKLSLIQPGIAVITVSFQDSECVRKCVVWVKNRNENEPREDFLTPQEFKEESDTDDTASFNRAINNLRKAGCDTVYVPAGTYLINTGTGINLTNNMKLIMAPDAVLEAIPNSLAGYKIISVNNVSNVKVSGGQIVGERYEHGNSEGEWGMGIGLYDSDNIIISDVKISDCWGDGIYIGSNDDANLNLGCENITITNCTLNNNRRNNLSIVNGDDVTINNCTISNANGTAPEYGIDIETNNEDNPCEHIRIVNSTFTGNMQGSLGVVTAADDIIVSNCTLKGRIINYAGTNVIISNSEICDKMYARIGVTMLNHNVLNAGTAAEDTLVASFNAGRDNFTIGKYNIDSSNAMLGGYMDSELSSSGKVLRMERTVQGTKETGYYLNLSDLLENGDVKLEAGCTYRFEYVTRGYGQWGVKTDQTAWYPCVPQSDSFATGMTFYEAKDKGAPYRIIFFAQEMTKGMCLEVDSIKIYKVN